jgi:hypothetical protein
MGNTKSYFANSEHFKNMIHLNSENKYELLQHILKAKSNVGKLSNLASIEELYKEQTKGQEMSLIGDYIYILHNNQYIKINHKRTILIDVDYVFFECGHTNKINELDQIEKGQLEQLKRWDNLVYSEYITKGSRMDRIKKSTLLKSLEINDKGFLLNVVDLDADLDDEITDTHISNIILELLNLKFCKYLSPGNIKNSRITTTKTGETCLNISFNES